MCSVRFGPAAGVRGSRDRWGRPRPCPPPPALHGLQLGFAVVHTCRRAACPGRVSPTTDEHKDCSRLWAGIAVRSLVWAEPTLTRGAGSHGGRGPGAASACSKHHRKLAPEWRAPSKETLPPFFSILFLFLCYHQSNFFLLKYFISKLAKPR